jgi:MFS family permease
MLDRLGRRGDRALIVARFGAPLLASVLSALLFLALQVPVGDLWAARARQSAAAHGAGPDYWFSWFGGGSPPASYSLISPYLSIVVGSAVLGAIATVITVVLVAVAANEAAHPVAAVWVAVVASGFDLWSGRIAFIVGTAFAAALVIAVRANRIVIGGVLGLGSALSSPVVAVFLVVALTGVVLLVPGRRLAASVPAAGAGATLCVMALVFGSPGVEPTDRTGVYLLLAALALMLMAQPASYVTFAVVVSIAGLLVLVLIPNPIGGNFNRMAWIWLPIAVVATARRRAVVAVSCVSVAVIAGMAASINDLRTAFSPAASTAQYAPLLRAVDRVPAMQDYRLETVSDGTHDAAYFLLDHATIARGYETQVDARLNPALWRSSLDAASYRAWLDRNAVGFVVFHRSAPSATYEGRLVAHGLDYLHPIWSDPNWVLYRVEHAVPIVAPPGRMTDADQGALTLAASRSARIEVRVRWSPALEVSGPPGARAAIGRGPEGWTQVSATRPGYYVLSG